MYEWMMEEEERDSRPATEAEAHVEWHLNSGVPMGQPCPWDACDPGEEHYEDEELIQLFQPITEEPAPDMRAEGVEEAWLGWIEGTYGVVLGDGQLYADTSGRVYAASEYVATLSKVGGQWQLDPAAAHSWSEQLAHRPRHLHTTEVAERRA